MATGDPSVRPWRTPATRVTSSASKRMRGARDRTSQAPAGQLSPAISGAVVDRLGPAGKPFDDDDERPAMGLAGGEEAEHPVNLLFPW